MTVVKARIGTELYKTTIRSSSGNTLISDEPASVGGKDLGFSPTELLASSLAACTSATVRMYADRKNWNLEEVKVEVELERNDAGGKTIIRRQVSFAGNLDETQRSRLLAVANACPIHKILTHTIEVETKIV